MSFLRSTRIEIAVLVHVADVAGQEEAVDERRCGLLRPVPVAGVTFGPLMRISPVSPGGSTRRGSSSATTSIIDAGQRQADQPGALLAVSGSEWCRPARSRSCPSRRRSGMAGQRSRTAAPPRPAAARRRSRSTRSEDRSRFSMPGLGGHARSTWSARRGRWWRGRPRCRRSVPADVEARAQQHLVAACRCAQQHAWSARRCGTAAARRSPGRPRCQAAPVPSNQTLVDRDRRGQVGVGQHGGARQAGGAAGVLQHGDVVRATSRPVRRRRRLAAARRRRRCRRVRGTASRGVGAGPQCRVLADDQVVDARRRPAAASAWRQHGRIVGA